MFKFSSYLISIVTTHLLISTPANAQSAIQPSEIKAVFACKAISAPLERLACYDNSVGRFEAAEKSGEVVAVSKAAIENVERDAFGFNIPSLPSLSKIFGGNKNTASRSSKPQKESDLTAPVKQVGTKKPLSEPIPVRDRPSIRQPNKVTEVTLKLRKATEFGYKKTRFFTINGQVWEQVDSTKVRIPKVRGDNTNTVEISKASLGSFFLRVNGSGKAIRVRRVR